MSHNSLKQGVFFILLAMFCMSINDLVIKKLSGGYPLHQMVFVRSVVGLLFSLIILQFEGGFSILKTKRPFLHILRALFVFISNMTFFAALAVLPLGHATALFFVAPILITLLSIPLLGEKVGVRRILAVIVGFIGVIVMMKPHTWSTTDISPIIFMLPVIGAFFYALMQILTRKLSIASKPSAMAVYIQSMFLTLSLCFGLVTGDGSFAHVSDNPSIEFLLRAWLWPTAQDIPLFIVLGIVTGGIGYSLSRAYSVADAAAIAPFEYVLLPIAIFWGWMVFGDLPDAPMIIGIILIVGSGFYVFWRERVQNAPNSFDRPIDP